MNFGKITFAMIDILVDIYSIRKLIKEFSHFSDLLISMKVNWLHNRQTEVITTLVFTCIQFNDLGEIQVCFDNVKPAFLKLLFCISFLTIFFR